MELNEEEKLARYIYTKKYYRPSDSSVKHNAFMPPKDKQLSTFRIYGLTEKEIWALSVRSEPVIARGDITVSDVRSTGLNINPDDQPTRHANIIGWPDEYSGILQRAIQLSEKAILIIR